MQHSVMLADRVLAFDIHHAGDCPVLRAKLAHLEQLPDGEAAAAAHLLGVGRRRGGVQLPEALRRRRIRGLAGSVVGAPGLRNCRLQPSAHRELLPPPIPHADRSL